MSVFVVVGYGVLSIIIHCSAPSEVRTGPFDSSSPKSPGNGHSPPTSPWLPVKNTSVVSPLAFLFGFSTRRAGLNLCNGGGIAGEYAWRSCSFGLRLMPGLFERNVEVCIRVPRVHGQKFSGNHPYTFDARIVCPAPARLVIHARIRRQKNLPPSSHDEAVVWTDGSF